MVCLRKKNCSFNVIWQGGWNQKWRKAEVLTKNIYYIHVYTYIYLHHKPISPYTTPVALFTWPLSYRSCVSRRHRCRRHLQLHFASILSVKMSPSECKECVSCPFLPFIAFVVHLLVCIGQSCLAAVYTLTFANFIQHNFSFFCFKKWFPLGLNTTCKIGFPFCY